MANAVVSLVTAERVEGIVRYGYVGRHSETDADGRYVFSEVESDYYYVLACLRDYSGRPGPRTSPGAWGPAVFSVTGDGSPRRVRVGRDADVAGVDLVVHPLPTHDVVGRLVRTDGTPLSGRSLLLTPGADTAVPAVPAGAVTFSDADGRFAFRDVPAGSYRLQNFATFGYPSDPFAVASIAVPGTEGIVLRAGEGFFLRGEVTFEEGTAHPSTEGVFVLARSIDFRRSPIGPLGGGVVLRGDWTFEAGPRWGAQIIYVSRPPTGWAVDHVEVAGHRSNNGRVEVSGAGFAGPLIRVVLTREWLSVSGEVEPVSGASTADIDIVAFSVNEATWEAESPFVRSTRAEPTGRFTLKSLPDGDYWVTAVSHTPSHEWRRFDILQDLQTSATRVAVRRGHTVRVRVAVRRLFEGHPSPSCPQRIAGASASSEPCG